MADNDTDMAVAMANEIHAAIARHADPRGEDGFSDAMAAMTVVAVGLIATAPAPGNILAYAKATNILQRCVMAGLCDDQTREEALALLTVANKGKVH